jgi:hypothetical protein
MVYHHGKALRTELSGDLGEPIHGGPVEGEGIEDLLGICQTTTPSLTGLATHVDFATAFLVFLE